MVLYFKSNVVDPPAFLYCGRDKEENEELIKFGLDNDVWYVMSPGNHRSRWLTVQRFHVDNLSSAHIYLRLREGEDWKSIPDALLQDCAQLTKANSIEGNKKDNITVIYTPWKNLKKTGSMAVGQVGFFDDKLVKKQFVTARENAIVNRLNKTKEERHPDLRSEKEAVEKEIRKKERMAREEQKAKEKREKSERAELKHQRDHAYDEWQNEDNMRSNDTWDDDDFM